MTRRLNMQKYFSIALIFVIPISCLGQEDKLTGRDARLFRDTPLEKAALAIRDNDMEQLKQSLERLDRDQINIQEKRYGFSLLIFAVFREDYEAAKIILKSGGNPNLKALNSVSATIYAADKHGSANFISLLLNYGGNPNALADIQKPQLLRTPLIAASYHTLESVKVLIAAGADPNFRYKTNLGIKGGEHTQSALASACLMNQIEIIRYLIFDKAVDYNYPFMYSVEGNPRYITYFLRGMTFEIGSAEHRLKKEVINYIKKGGLDYDKEPIPPQYIGKYPESYLKEY
jgi:hypothetical protein